MTTLTSIGLFSIATGIILGQPSLAASLNKGEKPHVLMFGGETQNGEDGFFFEEGIKVREEVSCSFMIFPPKNPLFKMQFDEGLKDETLRAELENAWKGLATIPNDLDRIHFSQTASYIQNFMFSNRLLWCFVEGELVEVIDKGEIQNRVGPVITDKPHKTVAVNTGNRVFISLAEWKTMTPRSRVLLLRHEMAWSFLRDVQGLDIKMIENIVQILEPKLLEQFEPGEFYRHVQETANIDTGRLFDLVDRDFEIYDLGLPIKARLFRRGSRLISTYDITDSSLAGMSITSPNPNPKFPIVRMNVNKDLYFLTTRSNRWVRMTATDEFKHFDPLCQIEADDSKARDWQLLNIRELRKIKELNILDHIDPTFNPHSDYLIVQAQSFGHKTVKNINLESMQELGNENSFSSMPTSKYLCVKFPKKLNQEKEMNHATKK